MKQFDRVVLTKDMPQHSLRAGDVGTVVHVYDGDRAFEVEFFAAAGDTVAVVTVEAANLRLPYAGEVLHVRRS